MKKSLLLVCALIGGYATNGYAVDPIMWGAGDTFEGCYSWHCLSPESWYHSPKSRNCEDNYTAMCVYQGGTIKGVASCSSCKPGYDLAEDTSGITACSQSGDPSEDDDGVPSYKFTYCEQNCTASNCATSNWDKYGNSTVYQTRTVRSCTTYGASGTCNETTQYRCAAGYWGSPTNATSGCNECPEWKNIYTSAANTTVVRGTSAPGTNKTIAGCYIKPGTYYDATGTIEISGDCGYKS